jgi:hypothetical protein
MDGSGRLLRRVDGRIGLIRIDGSGMMDPVAFDSLIRILGTSNSEDGTGELSTLNGLIQSVLVNIVASLRTVRWMVPFEWSLETRITQAPRLWLFR